VAVEVSVLVEGGKAAAGATLGSALGPLGVNVGQVVTKINEETKQFAGMRVPVIIRVDPNTRAFTLIVGRPPVAALLLKEAKREKGSGKPKTEIIGDVSLAAIKRIAEHDAALGHHLATTIKTGQRCAYLPDPAQPAEWDE